MMPRSVAIAMLAAAVLTSACARNVPPAGAPARRERSRRGSDWPGTTATNFTERSPRADVPST